MLKKVKIESDALQVCMAHALSTEKEEIMGLLVGEVEDRISHVYATIILYRLDKRKDRVEISPEQLSNAATTAEMFIEFKNLLITPLLYDTFLIIIIRPHNFAFFNINRFYEIGLKTRVRRPMRIVGWYHSHPHITVWPSHVDVRTQAMYQLMDSCFVGIILSCFNVDNSNVGQMQVTCFQSLKISSSDPPRYERSEIEQEIVHSHQMSEACLESLATFPQLLLREESDAYTSTLGADDQDMVTAISNASAFSQTLMRVVELVCAPYIQTMEKELKSNQRRLVELKNKLEELRNDRRIVRIEENSIEIG